jgi:hypothetical protein
MASWSEVKSWLTQNADAKESETGLRILFPRPVGEPLALEVFAPSGNAEVMRLLVRLLPVSHCADRELAARLLAEGSFFEQDGTYCFRATLPLGHMTPIRLAGALRYFAGTTGDLARRLSRRPAAVETSWASAYAD